MFTKKQTSSSHRFAFLLPWIIWGIAAIFYFAQYFARVSIGVMTQSLTETFKTNSLTVGNIAAAFYYGYIPMQFLAGILFDHFKMKRLLVGALCFSSLGLVLFGMAVNPTMAGLGRFFLGAGSAFAFIGAIKLAATWFPIARLSFMTCMTQAIGIFGAVFGLAPIAYLVQHVGWRLSTLLITIIFILLLILSLKFIIDAPYDAIPEKEQGRHPIWQGLQKVIKNKINWYNALFIAFLYAPMVAIGELWGSNFFQTTFLTSPKEAATITALLFVGYGVGALLFGVISGKLNTRIPLMLVSATSSLVFFCIIVYFPYLNHFWLMLFVFFFGFVNGGSTLTYALASYVNPKASTGTAIALMSVMAILFGMISQPVIGWLLDLNGEKVNGLIHYTAMDYRIALISQVICILGAIIVAAIMWKRFRSDQYISKMAKSIL